MMEILFYLYLVKPSNATLLTGDQPYSDASPNHECFLVQTLISMLPLPSFLVVVERARLSDSRRRPAPTRCELNVVSFDELGR